MTTKEEILHDIREAVHEWDDWDYPRIDHTIAMLESALQKIRKYEATKKSKWESMRRQIIDDTPELEAFQECF